MGVSLHHPTPYTTKNMKIIIIIIIIYSKKMNQMIYLSRLIILKTFKNIFYIIIIWKTIKTELKWLIIYINHNNVNK
jgi:hypothetical protein